MKLSSLQEMVKDYEKITGESVDLTVFFFDDDFHDKRNRHLKYFPAIGFLIWGILPYEGERYFAILETYGKVTGMVDYIKDVMRMNGLSKIVTFTTRNPRAHIRKWKMQRHPDLDYDAGNHHYFVLTGTIENLR